jgi:NAD-dependent deacetylase
MPPQTMRRAQELSEVAAIFIVLGSSLQVQPAAPFPVLAKQNGAFLAIVNREATPLDEIADFHYRGPIRAFCTQLGPWISDC